MHLSACSLRGAPRCAWSNQHPLHLVERHFLGATVVKLRRAGAGMVRHERGILKLPAVFQISGDARCAKSVIANLGRDLTGFRAPPNHHVSVCLGKGFADELAGRCG
jgi:hypothetical protein